MRRYLVTLLMLLVSGSAGADPLAWRLLPWLTGDAGLDAVIVKRFKLDPERLPELRFEPPVLLLENRGGAPAALAYAPVQLEAGTYTFRFVCRYLGDPPAPLATARVGAAREDFELTGDWTEHAVTWESPGNLKDTCVALTLRCPQGRLEVREMQLVKVPFRARVLRVRGSEQWIVLDLPGLDATTLGTYSALFQVLPAREYSPRRPFVATPIAAPEQGAQIQGRPGSLGPFGLPPMEQPSVLRYRVVDQEGHIVHAGGMLRVGPQPPPVRTTGGRVRVESAGRILVEGKPFFPLGLYPHEDSDRVLKVADNLGLNLVLFRPCDDLPRLVEKARSQGVEVMCTADLKADEPDPKAFFENLKKRFAALPLFGWSVVDEPDLREAYWPVMPVAYQQLAEVDPRPLFHSNHSPSSLPRLWLDTDIAALDPYPISRLPAPLAQVGLWMDLARATRPEGRSVWYINQAFAEAPIWPEPPTPNQLRCMTWNAINHGARGIVYYALKEVMTPGYPNYEWDLMRSKLAPEIRRETHEIRELERFLTTESGPGLLDAEGPVEAALYRTASEQLLCLANLAPYPARQDLDLPGAWQEYAPGRPASPERRNRLQVELGAYEVRLFLSGLPGDR